MAEMGQFKMTADTLASVVIRGVASATLLTMLSPVIYAFFGALSVARPEQPGLRAQGPGGT